MLPPFRAVQKLINFCNADKDIAAAHVLVALAASYLTVRAFIPFLIEVTR